MINSIRDGIALAIAGEFGESYEIYVEKVEQGLTAPCFLIATENSNFSRYRGQTFLLEAAYSITYFPKTEEIREECSAVWVRLMTALETLSFGEDESIAATELVTHIDKDFMTADVSYSRYLVLAQEDAEKLERMELILNIKED